MGGVIPPYKDNNYETMTFDDLKANIADKIDFGRYVVQTFSDNVEEIAQFETRIVTLYLNDHREVEGRYVSKDNSIAIHTFFSGEHKIMDAQGKLSLEELIELLATVIYDLTDLWGEDAWLEWLGD